MKSCILLVFVFVPSLWSSDRSWEMGLGEIIAYGPLSDIANPPVQRSFHRRRRGGESNVAYL
jgi:hypothetical protein